MSLLTDCRPTNPMRPPDWRWQLAVHAVENDAVVRTRGDAARTAARKFRSAWAVECGGDEDRAAEQLPDKFPDMYEAWNLYRQDGGSASLLKFEIEARVLAGQPDDEIAQVAGLPDETIATYCDVFFDVRPRLKSSAYICHQVLGRRMHFIGAQGLTDRDPHYLWKVFGWVLGPQALDWLIYRGRSADLSMDPQSGEDRIDAVNRRTTKLKGMLAIQMLSLYGDTSMTLLVESAHRLRDLERQLAADQGGGAAFQAVENVRRLITDFAWERSQVKRLDVLEAPHYPPLPTVPTAAAAAPGFPPAGDSNTIPG